MAMRQDTTQNGVSIVSSVGLGLGENEMQGHAMSRLRDELKHSRGYFGVPFMHLEIPEGFLF